MDTPIPVRYEYAESTPPMGDPAGSEQGTGRAGSRVGPYRLKERIGQGGMGVVFAAERADGQFQQTAARPRVPEARHRRQGEPEASLPDAGSGRGLRLRRQSSATPSRTSTSRGAPPVHSATNVLPL
jgi:hypothetical protein